MVDANPMRLPEINALTLRDIFAAIRAGWRDFRRAPALGIAVSALFSVIGVVITVQLFVWGDSYWVLPIAAGFPLVGPFAAVGLYDVSRRLEQGAPVDWASVLSAINTEKSRQIPWIAFVTLFFFLVWVYMAHLVFALTFGLAPLTNVMSSPDFLISQNGLVMLVFGTIIGGALSLALFSVTVVSIPMLMDREIDFVSAMIVSVRAVQANPGPMLFWGACIAGLTLIAILPLFLGMFVIFPVLGHASWHLYRTAVAP